MLNPEVLNKFDIVVEFKSKRLKFDCCSIMICLTATGLNLELLAPLKPNITYKC